MSEGSVSDRIKGQLENGSAISASDLAEFSKPTTEGKEPKVDPMSETSMIHVPHEAKQDPIMAAADGSDTISAFQGAISDDPAGTNQYSDSMIEPLDIDEIEVTAAEKSLFIESLITGGRFKLSIPLLGGSLLVTFQSRKNSETRAVAREMNRRAQDGSMSEMQFSELTRQSILRFQVVEVGDVTYNPVEGPLSAVTTAVDGKEVVVPPKWYEEAEVFFGADKSEGLIATLYRALQIFEAKYWAMVKHAEDQDFWHPEDSTSA